MANTRKEELQDPLTVSLIKAYADAMNSRFYSDAILPLIGKYSPLQEKMTHICGLYNPYFLDKDMMERFSGTYQVIELTRETAKISSLQKVATYGIVIGVQKLPRIKHPAEPIKDQLRAVLEFAPYQERVYIRIARALKEIGEEQEKPPQKIVGNIETTDEALRHAFPKHSPASKFYRALADTRKEFDILLSHLNRAKPEPDADMALLLTEEEIDIVHTASLEHITRQLDRIYSSRPT